MLVGTAAGGATGAAAPTISNQLMFHPPLAWVVTILTVCAPAASVTDAETFYHVWKLPVLGTVTVASTDPSCFLSWKVAPLNMEATRKLTVKVPAVAAFTE